MRGARCLRALRRLGAVVAVAAAVVPAVAPAASAGARAPGQTGACQDRTGITVVVDQTAFGGGVEVRCAAQPVESGFDALTKAGFTYTGTIRFPGLLCRIDGQPASDPCQGAPPPDAYWAYWHAERGGAWTYSTSGAARTPPPGSVEGWAFGDRAAPGIAPPAPATHPTTTTTPPTTVPAPVGGQRSGATPPDTPPADEAPAPPPGDPADPEVGRPASTVVDPSGELASPETVRSSTVDDAGPGTGSPVGVLITAAVLVGAGVLARRVRRVRADA